MRGTSNKESTKYVFSCREYLMSDTRESTLKSVMSRVRPLSVDTRAWVASSVNKSTHPEYDN
jgi:hypothetical protein